MGKLRLVRRSSFTLIELLVVTAITALLLGLLLPAVHKFRTAVALVQCENNLKQIGLAALSYERTQTHFPAGSDGGEVGPLVSLLPYLGQQPVADGFELDPPTQVRPWWANPRNRPPTTGLTTAIPGGVYGGQPVVKIFLCPAAPVPGDYATVLLAAPQGNVGQRHPNCKPAWADAPDGAGGDVASGMAYPNYPAPHALRPGFTFSGLPGGVVLGPSNYLPMGGYPYFDSGTGVPGQFTGIFTYQSATRLADVTDGTGSTILFGEYSSAYLNFGAGHPLTGWCAGSWGCGPIYTYWPPTTAANLDPANGVWYAFGSRHPGRFNCAYADGSVHGLSNGIDGDTWLALGGMQDGWELSTGSR